MKKKILFVASIPEHITAFHLPYLELLKDKGYEIHIATNGSLDYPIVDKIYSINFNRSPFRIFQNFIAYKTLRNLINTQEYSVISSHTPVVSILTRLASILARKKGTKVIYTAHGFHFYKGASIVNWLLYYPVEKFLIKYTDAIITINDEDYNLLKKIGYKKCQYFLMPGMGVDSKIFYPSEEKKTMLREAIFGKDSSNKMILTYVARLEKDKGHDFIIDVVCKHKELFNNIQIIFVGDGIFRSRLEDRVKKGNASNIIKFLGFRRDISDIFRLSDYCLSVSIREGFGINIVEGLLSGLPVIATKNRGHNMILNEKCAYLFDINDEPGFISAILEVNNIERYLEMSESALHQGKKIELNNSLKEFDNILKVLKLD